MTEEEYFRKNYPNSCYGDKPLSPHWDFFQDGVEFGERQSEKRIEELEATNKTISNECHKLVDSLEKKQNEVAELKEQLRDKKCNNKDCPVFIKLIQANKGNTDLKKACDKTQELLDKQIEATYKLDKENAELLCQKNKNKACYSCANATERCFRNEIGCPCQNYKSYKEENAELRKRVNELEEINEKSKQAK